MRLISVKDLQLVDFANRPNPPYAILSHTWGDEEVTYQEVASFDATLNTKSGWLKVTAACSLASQHGIDFVWIDTCYIDKSSSAELTEAINSMYAWYLHAEVCYVFLSDLPHNTTDDATKDSLAQCWWWRRGWTLQELLAPTQLQFYDQAWSCIGTKSELIDMIADCSGIAKQALNGDLALDTFSVAIRMSWAARRQTTRIEDEAYCLLGIFGVNMPLIYGEGRRAFRRLQEEIVKNDNDLTIFAADNQTTSLFAEASVQFQSVGHLLRFPHTLVDFAVTNRGLRFTGYLPLRLCAIRKNVESAEAPCLVLFLGHTGQAYDAWGLVLEKIGPRLYAKACGFGLIYFRSLKMSHIKRVAEKDVCIVLEPRPSYEVLHQDYRKHAVHVPKHPTFRLGRVVPQSLWDFGGRMFLKPGPQKWMRWPQVLAMHFKAEALGSLIVLCDGRLSTPVAKVLEFYSTAGESRAVDLLFQDRCREDSMSWIDLEMSIPGIKELGSDVYVSTSAGSFHVSVSIKTPMLSEDQYRLVLDMRPVETEEMSGAMDETIH